MKYISLLSLLLLMVLVGCGPKQPSKITFWDGKSVGEFQGKTMTSMVWLKTGKGSADHSIENMQVFKRFDGADFKMLLSCLENPELKHPPHEERLGQYLYLSFLDGTRYIIDFRDSFPFASDGDYTIILPNGQSRKLYNILMEKEPCPAFEPLDPRMDKYGRVNDPNGLMQ